MRALRSCLSPAHIAPMLITTESAGLEPRRQHPGSRLPLSAAITATGVCASLPYGLVAGNIDSCQEDGQQ